MNKYQIVITIGLAVIGTVLTRCISFILFPNPQKIPDFVRYLGKVLPFAVMGLLVVFSYKDVSFADPKGFIVKMIASAIVIGSHIFKRNMLLSIAGGTISYIILLQLIKI